MLVSNRPSRRQYWYDTSGRLLTEQVGSISCGGVYAEAGMLAEQEDLICLFGMPVEVLFSSADMDSPECGVNFILPNHLGVPLRLLDNQGNITQSPEVGPVVLEEILWADPGRTAPCSDRMGRRTRTRSSGTRWMPE